MSILQTWLLTGVVHQLRFWTQSAEQRTQEMRAPEHQSVECWAHLTCHRQQYKSEMTP